MLCPPVYQLSTIHEGAIIDSHSFVDPRYQAYCQPIENKLRRLREAVHRLGLEFGPNRFEEISALKRQFTAFDLKQRNNAHSLFLNRLSPACKYCNRAEGSTTFILTLACNRDCFFCTNRNQHNYEQLSRTTNDVISQFDNFAQRQKTVQAVALTGGEPLLHPDMCRDFFHHVKAHDARIHTRLYSNGDLVTDDMLSSLSPWLNEIRLGLKPDMYGEFLLQPIGDVLSCCARHISQVTVEVPVMPNSFANMVALLELCNTLDIFSVNLLEFLFPWHHADWYQKQGYRIKKRPYKVLYNYDYAGGLPIDGSETEALRCLLHASRHEFRVGVHYCSLENKLTSQIYQQNKAVHPAPTELASQEDHFLKSVRFLGTDADKAYRILRNCGVRRLIRDIEQRTLECHPEDLLHLKTSDIREAVLTYAVAENEKAEGLTVVREVHMEQIDPQTFDPFGL